MPQTCPALTLTARICIDPVEARVPSPMRASGFTERDSDGSRQQEKSLGGALGGWPWFSLRAARRRASAQFTRVQVWRLQNTLITQPETSSAFGPVSRSEPE